MGHVTQYVMSHNESYHTMSHVTRVTSHDESCHTISHVAQ